MAEKFKYELTWTDAGDLLQMSDGPAMTMLEALDETQRLMQKEGAKDVTLHKVKEDEETE